MNLNKLLPNASRNKSENNYDSLLYLFLVDFGWTYDKFLVTPIPVIMRLLKQHKKVKEAEAKANKK